MKESQIPKEYKSHYNNFYKNTYTVYNTTQSDLEYNVKIIGFETISDAEKEIENRKDSNLEYSKWHIRKTTVDDFFENMNQRGVKL